MGARLQRRGLGYVQYGWLPIPFQVTAGHCPDEMRHVTHVDTYETITEGATYDGQAMYAEDAWTDWTTVIDQPGFPNFEIASEVVAGGYGDRVGDWVCKDGFTSGYTCGQLVSVDYDCVIGPQGPDARWSTTFSDHGDSGGTVFTGAFGSYDAALAGFVSSGPNCNPTEPFTDTTYPFAPNVRTDLSLTDWFYS